MEDAGGVSKLTGNTHIARLKEIFYKWQTGTLGSNSNVGISPMMINKRLSNLAIKKKRLSNLVYCDSDEDSCCNSPKAPHDIPKGYLAVYVGPELRRFIIPTTYLTHSLFKVLLEKTADEFGFDQSGGLTIPCEIETFKYLLSCMEMENNNHQHQHNSSSENTASMEK